MIRLLVSAASLALIASCAGTPEAEQSAQPQRRAASAIDAPGLGLPAQRLAPGECGLFLWELAAPRAFVFFTRDIEGETLALIADAPASLTLTRAGGDVFGQFLTELDYRHAQSGTEVWVRIEPGEMLDGGQRIDTGYIVFRDPGGWETTKPVTGVRACTEQ
jgi:hypothetical protein